jgi:CBS domain containing-hemolysin-like protein
VNNATVIVGLVLVVISSLFATLNLALHDMPWGRLTRALGARRRERWIEAYRDHQDDFICATSIVRMVSNLGLILVITQLFEADRAANLALYYAEVFGLCAVVLLICVVAIPQPCAKYAAVPLLANLLPVLQAVRFLTTPINAVLHLFDGLIRRLAGVPKPNRQDEAELIEQEVLDAVDEAALHGAVDRDEKAMIKSVMELDESSVGEIMTPRTEVVGIAKDATLGELKELIRKEGHSRIPVYDENIDQVLGMVYAKDLLHVEADRPFDLMQHIRAVPFVPETKLLDDLLSEFRTGRTHVAIVLDEYGGTAGLVTIEDILEELVGEITDEYEQPEPEPVQRISEQVVEVDSKVHVHEINELLGLEIPEGDDYETIGGFVFSAMGKIPHSGEHLVHDSARITILEAEDRKINRLRIELLHQESEL